MNVFVTGAAGFIGSALAARLARDGHEVRGLARRPERTPAPEGARLVRGDLAAADGLDGAREVLAKADAIVHLAAVRKDWGTEDDALRRVNVASGPALLALAPRVQRVLFVSSVAVYGHARDGRPIREDAPFTPAKRYGASKVEAEAAVTEAAARRGVALTIARPGITYGPRDTYGMVANLARLVSRGKFLRVGPGTSRVNLLFVDDLAEGLARALVAPEAAGEDFIFAGKDAVPVRRLVETVAREVGRSVPSVGVPEWAARLAAAAMERTWRAAGIGSEPFLTRSKVDLFTRDDVYDISKARRALGFDPEVGVDAGVRRAVAWLREAGELS